MDSFNELVAQRIRSWRDNVSVSQEELARRVGITRATVANIENCRQGISFELFLRISTAMNQEPTSLVSEEMVNSARTKIPSLLGETFPDQDRERVEAALSDLIP